MSHFDARGNAVMADVTDKPSTCRLAIASGRIHVNAPVMEAVAQGTAAKGDVLGVARVAGIMAAKGTAGLIPMCHPLILGQCAVDFTLLPQEGVIEAICTVRVSGQTGVEMEALTGVSVALLTVYDMCKALDRAMEISSIRLVRKEGGKSGVFSREAPAPAPPRGVP
ncbi:MAG: cyclic pyranopterin monophosphate synthase MoaC [Clostridiales bacterium]|nr:cyclic pyranopterin monophosphate synthase MoaC [Clostridiales bacterium]